MMAPPPVRLRRTTPPYHTEPFGRNEVTVVCEWCSARSEPLPKSDRIGGYAASLMGDHGGVLTPHLPAECPEALPPLEP